jgi:hypothetical protein
VVIGTDCRGRCKSNYHIITSMMAPALIQILMIKQYNCNIFH